MHTGIHEWCQDYYDPGYYAVSPGVDPQGPSGSQSSRRVVRGGSELEFMGELSRSSYRLSAEERKRASESNSIGLRLCRDPD